MVKLQKMEVSKPFQTFLQFKTVRLASTFVVGRYVLQMVHVKLLHDSESATVQHTWVEGSSGRHFKRRLRQAPQPVANIVPHFFLLSILFRWAPAHPTRKSFRSVKFLCSILCAMLTSSDWLCRWDSGFGLPDTSCFYLVIARNEAISKKHLGRRLPRLARLGSQ